MVTIQVGQTSAVYMADGWTSNDPDLEEVLDAMSAPIRAAYSPADGRPDLFVVARVLEQLDGARIIATSIEPPAPAGTVF